MCQLCHEILGLMDIPPDIELPVFLDTPTYFIVEGSANICKWIIALDNSGTEKRTANRIAWRFYMARLCRLFKVGY